MILPHAHYFSKTVNREVKEVYWFAAINYLALSLSYIFEPIYLYNLHYSIIQILWFYVMVYAWYTALVFLGAKVVSKIGYKHSILAASICYVVYWTILYQIGSFPILFFVAPFFFALQKSLFWPAYNADIALGSVKQQRGREVGALLSEIELVSILGPVLGGLISSQFGFGVLFGLSAILTIGSVYPLFKSPDIYTHHRFHFENFKKVFRKYKSNFFGYWGYAEDLMLMSLWPIFIFVTVPYFLGVGAITTFASLTATVIMLYVGRLTDRIDKSLFIRWSAVVYSMTWMFRFLATSLGAVMVFDVLTRMGKAVVNVPMLSLTYEIAGSKDADYAIAYNVFFEFSLAIGKIVTALLAIAILAATGNIHLVFAMVGALTLFYGFLRNK